MNPRNFSRILALSLIAILTTLMTAACSRYQSKSASNSGGSLSDGSAGSVIGVKTAEQILRTMSTLTGVSITRTNIASTYSSIKGQLPQTTDASSFQASHQGAVTKLATEFCIALIDTAGMREPFTPGVNYNQTPAQTLASSTTREGVIQAMTSKIWGSNLERNPDAATTKAELQSLFTDLTNGAPATTTATRSVLKGVCTAVLASTPVVML